MEGMNVDYHAALPTIGTKEGNTALREKTDQFEAVILKLMLDEAMKEEKNIFTAANDPGERIYGSMYREELSNASAGSFGFSQMLFDYLSDRGKTAQTV